MADRLNKRTYSNALLWILFQIHSYNWRFLKLCLCVCLCIKQVQLAAFVFQMRRCPSQLFADPWLSAFFFLNYSVVLAVFWFQCNPSSLLRENTSPHDKSAAALGWPSYCIRANSLHTNTSCPLFKVLVFGCWPLCWQKHFHVQLFHVLTSAHNRYWQVQRR